jgi:lactoylglutathione lyase
VTDSARNFGHLAFRVDDIYATCARPAGAGLRDNRPRATVWLRPVTHLVSVELLQDGNLPPQEP